MAWAEAGGPVMMGGMGTSADADDAGHAGACAVPARAGGSHSCPVGTTSLYLKDVSRPDPWATGE
jgi:hypothetical protein